MNLNNELALHRTRKASERTLMAWTRTSLALIGFGFGLHKVIQALYASHQVPLSKIDVDILALVFLMTGVFSLISAVYSHNKELDRLLDPDFVYKDSTRFVSTVSLMIALTGVVASVLVITSWLR